MLIFQMTVQAGPQVTLSWNPVSDPNVAGVNIHFGMRSHRYTATTSVQGTNSVVIPLPRAGATYYFAATCYDRFGNQSAYSNEAVYVAPAAATLDAASFSANQISFTVNGTTNKQYVIQASTNLVDWFPVQTNAAPFTFAATNNAGFKSCFYRAVSP